MGSQDASVCCDRQSHQSCFLPVKISKSPLLHNKYWHWITYRVWYAIKPNQLSITEPSQWFIFGVIQNSLQHIDPPIWPKDFLIQRTLFHCSIVQFLLLFTWAFWHSFTSSTIVSWQQFCHIGQLHRDFSSQWMLTHFSQKIGSVVQWYLKQAAFCHTSWWVRWNCPLLSWLVLIYQPYFWSCFVLFPDVF